VLTNKTGEKTVVTGMNGFYPRIPFTLSMGFLDTLFGGGKTRSSEKKPQTATVEYSKLGRWLGERLDVIEGEKVRDAGPALENIRKILSELGKNVDHLDSKGLPKDVPKRFTKVVKTNKPSYVKKMRNIINTLQSGITDELDASEYNKLVGEKLNSISKISYGEGRYLTPAYPDILAEIRSKSKRLFDEQKQLAETMKASEEENQLMQVQKDYQMLTEIQIRLADAKNVLGENKTHLRDEEKSLALEKQNLDDVLKKIKSPEVEGLIVEVGASEKEKKAVEELIFSHVSRLKKGMRKFAKHSARDSDLVNSLVENPVDGFLSSEPTEFSELVSAVAAAVRENKISVKDKEKTLARITEAEKTLSNELRSKHTRLSSDVAELGKKLEGVSAFKQEREIRSRVRDLEETIRGLNEALSKDKSRCARNKAEIKDLEKQITAKLAEINVEVKH